MNLNRKQKRIIIVCIVLITVCWLFPPTERQGRVEATNYLGLLVNWLGALILGGLACLWAKGPEIPLDEKALEKQKRVVKSISVITGSLMLISAIIIGGYFAYDEYQATKVRQAVALEACERVERKVKNGTPLKYHELDAIWLGNEFCSAEQYGYKHSYGAEIGERSYFYKEGGAEQERIVKSEKGKWSKYLESMSE
ncbi:hypothetical protein [Desulfosediminicola ganghwensis]|uniref:hypothetical protein n=1 Tax=Desulfosediminicola ganghwensis TaxID=2569540 RepID=UPI0010AB61F7|nr:hypothetical protein [Desulfosediminicola ganghwensis]